MTACSLPLMQARVGEQCLSMALPVAAPLAASMFCVYDSSEALTAVFLLRWEAPQQS